MQNYSFNPWTASLPDATWTANQWLIEHRPGATPITKQEVLDRLNKGMFLTSADAKTTKGEALGWRTLILYLAPATIIGQNLCPGHTKECFKHCLFNAGRGRFTNVTRARIVKTLALIANPDLFIDKLFKQIDAATRRHERVAYRLNGTSDLPWHIWARKQILSRHVPGKVQAYDYTKVAAYLPAATSLRGAYHVTFSVSDSVASQRYLSYTIRKQLPGHFAVVSETLPNDGRNLSWALDQRPCIDGDAHDLRFLDPRDAIVVLRPKGSLKKADSKFKEAV